MCDWFPRRECFDDYFEGGMRFLHSVTLSFGRSVGVGLSAAVFAGATTLLVRVSESPKRLVSFKSLTNAELPLKGAGFER